MNESWRNLEELDLNENPLVGDLGVAYLSLNKIWVCLKQFSIEGCNIGVLGRTFLQRNPTLRALIPKLSMNEEGTFEFRSTAKMLKDSEIVSAKDPTTVLNKLLRSKLSQQTRPNLKIHLRGGSSKGSNNYYSEQLLSKLHRYKEKVLNDQELDNNLYIEHQTKLIIGYANNRQKEFDDIEGIHDDENNNRMEVESENFLEEREDSNQYPEEEEWDEDDPRWVLI